VRNPLNAIGMIGQRMQHEFEPVADKTEYRKLTDTVVAEVKRINGIVQRFLKFAKPPELVLTENDLVRLVHEVASLLKPEAAAMDIEIRLQMPEKLTASFDYDQMKQVFLNLIQNAMQASSAGQHVSIRLQTKEDVASVEVVDIGSGINAEDIPRIFDLYFTTRTSGTGMGLSIANQIVNAHSGRIKVQSEAGSGTSITVLLPLQGPKAQGQDI
jgi:signal transduction histidine kinase